MKKIALLLAGVAGLVASPAHALLTVNLSLPSGTFDSPSVFCTGSAPCSFTETATFTTPSPYNLASASITSSRVGNAGSTSDINFTSVMLNGTALTLTSILGGAIEIGGLSNLSFLAPGTHTLTVTGITYGTGAGFDSSYSGTLTFATATAVPEPATWLSMVLGFGVLGVALRRGAKKTARKSYNLG
jgi:PEP-CTERM motif